MHAYFVCACVHVRGKKWWRMHFLIRELDQETNKARLIQQPSCVVGHSWPELKFCHGSRLKPKDIFWSIWLTKPAVLHCLALTPYPKATHTSVPSWIGGKASNAPLRNPVKVCWNPRRVFLPNLRVGDISSSNRMNFIKTFHHLQRNLANLFN